MRKAPRNPEPAKRWAAFLTNHREAIAAMDFSTVPTLNFGILYCFFVIAHDRRQVLHCMRPNIRPPLRSFSSCVRHFHTTRLPNTLSSIAVQASMKK